MQARARARPVSLCVSGYFHMVQRELRNGTINF